MRRGVTVAVAGLVSAIALALGCAWIFSGWMAPELTLPLVLGGALCT